jgi:hypothetical protein
MKRDRADLWIKIEAAVLVVGSVLVLGKMIIDGW